MKKTVFMALSLVLSLAVLPLYAQKGEKGNGKHGSKMGMRNPVIRLNMMQDKLGLTDAQVDKMYKIKKDYMEKSYQNRNNPDKIKELKGKCREEMDNVLTPEQKAKKSNFAKDSKMKKGDGKSGKDEKKTAKEHRISRMQNKLGLTNDQCDKIFKIHKDYMDQFYKNRKDENKIKELQTKQIGEIQNVLTPEQKTKWDEMKKNSKNGNKNQKKK